MHRLTLLTAALFTFAAITATQARPDEKDDKDKIPEGTNLILELPYCQDPREGRPEILGKLTVDGKDFTEIIPARTRYLKVTPAKGKDTVKVVYSFWPVGWSNTVRTKVVKLADKGITRASLLDEDKATPDKIFPIFYPTPVAVVDEMCKMGKVGKADVVYDIGCGDGRLIIRSLAKFGAKKGVGIELDKELCQKCKDDAKKAGVGDKAVFIQQDALAYKDYSEASVVLLYVGDQFGEKIGPVLKKQLKPGSRIVSHRFILGDWKPDQTFKKTLKNNYDDDEEYVLHIWTVPEPKKAKE